MKRTIILAGIAVAILLYSCGKSSTPTPTPPVTPPPVVPPVVNTTATITGFMPETAEAGAEITITGTNFGTVVSDVSVKFGASAAVTPKSVSNTQIIVVVPAGAETGKIAVSVKTAAAVLSGNSFILKTKPVEPTFKNIIINGAGMVFIDGIINDCHFGSNAGVDIELEKATAGINIEIVNEELGDILIVNVADGSTLNFSNIIVNKNNKFTSEEIAANFKTRTYIKIPVTKALYGVDEIHAYLNNDGTYKAPQVNFLGNKIPVTSENIDAYFKTSKLKVAKLLLAK
jgi:uncharacterized protein (TIGR03437 family)